jgi:hypothetical protein
MLTNVCNCALAGVSMADVNRGKVLVTLISGKVVCIGLT